jgi:predicted translin family RNA/ssDNA-binding protein
LLRKKKESFRKVAGLFGEGAELKRVSEAIQRLKGDIQGLNSDYRNVHSNLRASMPKGFSSDKVQSAFNETEQAEQNLNEKVDELKSLFGEHGELKQKEANKNYGIAAGFGIPGLVGLGYVNEQAKNN